MSGEGAGGEERAGSPHAAKRFLTLFLVPVASRSAPFREANTSA